MPSGDRQAGKLLYMGRDVTDWNPIGTAQIYVKAKSPVKKLTGLLKLSFIILKKKLLI